jgi:threonine/homoserine/homoserine lactone efflux protein
VGRWLNRKPQAGMWLDRAAGGIFIALGLKLLVSR